MIPSTESEDASRKPTNIGLCQQSRSSFSLRQARGPKSLQVQRTRKWYDVGLHVSASVNWQGFLAIGVGPQDPTCGRVIQGARKQCGIDDRYDRHHELATGTRNTVTNNTSDHRQAPLLRTNSSFHLPGTPKKLTRIRPASSSRNRSSPS